MALLIGAYFISKPFLCFSSCSFSSFAFSAHFALCPVQSATWHSLEQYQMLLHFEHRLKAYFWHFPHLKPSTNPSTLLFE